MRFTKAYLAAWLGALVTLTGVVLVAEHGMSREELIDLLAFFPLYTAVATLVLGVPVWLLLRSNGLDRAWHFALGGVAAGYVGLALLHPALMISLNRLSVALTLGGAIAAVTFRAVYGARERE